MSNQPQQQQTKVLELPTANYPLVNRVIADHPFPTEMKQGETPEPHRSSAVVWILGQPHPIVADMKVVRMYVVPGVSIEVYSSSADGKLGVRNVIPWNQVRLVEEVCDVQSFIDEIRDAEEGDDEPDTASPSAPAMNGLQPMPPNGGGVS